MSSLLFQVIFNWFYVDRLSNIFYFKIDFNLKMLSEYIIFKLKFIKLNLTTNGFIRSSTLRNYFFLAKRITPQELYKTGFFFGLPVRDMV